MREKKYTKQKESGQIQSRIRNPNRMNKMSPGRATSCSDAPQKPSVGRDFFAQGIIQSSASKATAAAGNSVYLREGPGIVGGGSPDANGNLNYDQTGGKTTTPSPNDLHQHQTKPSWKLYEKATNFGARLGSWNQKFAPFYALLLTYPSELHFVARTTVIAAVTGYVLTKRLAEVDWDKILQHDFVDEPGRVGVNKDFL